MPVCIAGMHRSGTSMVAKALHEAGLDLGPVADLMPPAEENPEGFWEHLDFVELNESLLAAAGGGWDCPPPADVDWSGDRFADARRRAEAAIAGFAGREPWGWKDPRNALTLPFWQALLPGLKVVFVVRNPLEVALSLRRRNGFSFALGLTLWRVYAERVLAAAAPSDRVITHFDAYFGDAEPEVRRVAARLDLSPPAGRREPVAAAADDLKHHRLTVADLSEAAIDPSIIELYRALCAEAEWRDPLEAGAMATVGQRREIVARIGAAERRPTSLPRPSTLEAGVGRTDRLALELELLQIDRETYRQALAGREARVAELELALHVHEAARGDLEGKVAERDARIAERERKLVEAEAAFQRLTREVRTLRQTVLDQKAQLAEAERRLEMQDRHEREQRVMLASLHQQLFEKDAEVMGTLGAALARFAPGAPASIYYRQLLQKVRGLVAAHLPPGVPVLVATYGDDELLRLDGRPALPYPQGDGGVAADYTSVDGTIAIAQLEHQRAQGAGFLIVPSPAQPWLARHAEIQRYLEARFPAIVQEQGSCTIYDLRAPVPAASA